LHIKPEFYLNGVSRCVGNFDCAESPFALLQAIRDVDGDGLHAHDRDGDEGGPRGQAEVDEAESGRTGAPGANLQRPGALHVPHIHDIIAVQLGLEVPGPLTNLKDMQQMTVDFCPANAFQVHTYKRISVPSSLCKKTLAIP